MDTGILCHVRQGHSLLRLPCSNAQFALGATFALVLVVWLLPYVRLVMLAASWDCGPPTSDALLDISVQMAPKRSILSVTTHLFAHTLALPVVTASQVWAIKKLKQEISFTPNHAQRVSSASRPLIPPRVLVCVLWVLHALLVPQCLSRHPKEAMQSF